MTQERVVTGLTLVEALTLAQRRISREFAAVLSEESCTVEQWRVMRALADGAGHAMGELAESLLIAHPTLTRLMDGLVESSMAYRRPSPGDRRRVAVYLSRRGQQRLARLNALAEAHDRALRDNGEWDDLSRLLRGF